jgi:flagellar hook-associated protein 2
MTSVSSSSADINTSRVSGLASGMDIDTIVSNLMKSESVTLDKLEQKQQILNWQQEDYRNLNTALYSFKDQAFSLKLEGTFNAKNAASSDATVLAVTAGVSSTEGTYAIKVNSLAAGVTRGSTTALASGKDADGKTLTLYEQFTEFATRGLSETDNITVNINGTDLTFDLDTDNMSTMVAKINNSKLGVKASYDSDLNRFFLTTDSTGSSSQITISSDTANFLASDSNDSILKLNIDEGVVYNGQNASINFGDATNLESATNTIKVNGITFNLKSEGSSTITVTRDIDAVVKSITDFVNSYNETLSTLYSKVQEKRDRDYGPLTKAQKENMSEAEITKWETIARSGLLRNDALLQNTINNFRSSISGTVAGIDGEYKTLSQIGITTQLYTDNGKLFLDESALREALTQDLNGVKKLFTNSSTTDGEKGIAYKLYEISSDGIKYISNKAGSTSSFSTVDTSYIGKRLVEMKQAIDKWEDKLANLEDRYYRRFTAMETAINKMNNQSSWLAAQFGSG